MAVLELLYGEARKREGTAFSRAATGYKEFRL